MKVDGDMTSTEKLTAQAELLLRNRYDYPEWAFFTEVNGEDGRSADAIAINMWPSRKYEIHGFEIKASRGDWLKELRTPSKADFFVGQCDRWFMVAAKKDIIRKEELPEDWGLLEIRNNRIFTAVHPDWTYKTTPSRRFYTNLVNKAFQKNDPSRHVIYQAEMRGRDQARKEASTEVQNEMDNLIEKVKVLETLEKNGIYLRTWNKDEFKRTISIMKASMALSEDGLIDKLDWVRRSAKKLMDMAEKDLKELKEACGDASKDRVQQNGK